MPLLDIHLWVSPDVDPALDDPEDLADDIINEYLNWRRSNAGAPEVAVRRAEWAG